jgi:hypothetical protein
VANNPGVHPDVASVTGVAQRLALSLATLVVDQTLLSESDVPFEPFALAFPVDQRVGPATLSPGRRSTGRAALDRDRDLSAPPPVDRDGAPR